MRLNAIAPQLISRPFHIVVLTDWTISILKRMPALRRHVGKAVFVQQLILPHTVCLPDVFHTEVDIQSRTGKA